MSLSARLTAGVMTAVAIIATAGTAAAEGQAAASAAAFGGAVPSDSIVTSVPREARAEGYRFRANQLIAPGALIAAGSLTAATGWGRRHIDREVTHAMGSTRHSYGVASVVEFVPLAVSIAGGLAIDTRYDVVDRTLLAATSFVVLEAVTQPLKRIVGRDRPDGSDRHSFPSGHTATAFAGAELMRLEYGPAWGAAGYAVATGVAAMRVAGRKHWLSDCVAGAGIGILSARAAAWLLPLERRLLGLSPKARCEVAIVPYAGSGGYGVGVAVAF